MRWATLVGLSSLASLAVWASPVLADADPGSDAGSYVVLQGAGEKDPYAQAGRLLAAHHGTRHLLPFDPDDPEAVLEALRKLEPRHVAIVVRPEQIHVNSVRAILRMATKVDDDPFVDFAFGYITGATAEEAAQFVRNIIRASKSERPKQLGFAGVWGGDGSSESVDDVYREGPLELPIRALRFRAPADGGRDQGFIDEHLARLSGCGAILMGGHGMPWELVHGPQGVDLGKLDLFPAVAFNYACHTGVTTRYPEREWKRDGSVERLKDVEAKRSFALNVIRAGITGYVAWVNPRPAGPEVHTDYARMLAGDTLGATRRRDYDKIALAYLGFGEKGIVPPVWKDGQTHSRASVDAVRHMMLDGATGGILYGDPSLRAFAPVDGALPLRSSLVRKDDGFTVTLKMPARSVWTFCGDPFRKFDGGSNGMARKIYDRFELPADAPEIKGVWITSATQGGREVATLPVVWALEEDRGKRYLHVKANWDYGHRGDVSVELIAAPRAAPAEAMEVRRPKREPAAKAEGETQVQAEVRAVNRRAMDARADLREDLAALEKHGEEAFDAVVELIRTGKGHWRTYILAGATKYEGAEEKLKALAEQPMLPGYGHWTALASLGEFDTPEVRTYLLARLARAKTKDAGVFFNAARALARLAEERAFEPTREQLMAFQTGWSGVEFHLLSALVELGGKEGHPELAAVLEAFATDERAVKETNVTMALAHLQNRDAEAAKRAAKKVVESQRFSKFAEITQQQIKQLAGLK